MDQRTDLEYFVNFYILIVVALIVVTTLIVVVFGYGRWNSTIELSASLAFVDYELFCF